AAMFLCRPLWRLGIVVGFCFVMYLEFLLKPGLFAWDMLAAFLVMVPAGDRSWAFLHDRECSPCLWNRTLLARFDWVRRVPAEAERFRNDSPLMEHTVGRSAGARPLGLPAFSL